MASGKHILRELGCERGFTLVELLVVMLSGTVVLSAAFTIIDVTLRQTTRTFTKVHTTERSRPVIDTIENELHSACVAPDVSPVKATSSGTTLIFVSQYGKAATLTPVEHVITYDSSAKTLTDATYAATGGAAPNWTFSGTASSTIILLTNVTQSGSTPVFQYFKYMNSGYSDAGGNAYKMLLDGTSAVPGTSTIPAAQPLSTPLSAADALDTAEVMTTFVVGPGGGTDENTTISSANTTVSDSVVLRLTPASNHDGTGASFEPCN